MDNSQENRALHADIASEYLFWVKSSKDMYAAAKIISEALPNLYEFDETYNVIIGAAHDINNPNIYNPYLLLVGYSIELLLKAVIVKNCSAEIHSFVKANGKLPKYLSHHNLKELREKSGIQIDPHTELSLLYFHDFTIWAGRYPVQKYSDVPGVGMKGYHGNTKNMVEELFEILFDACGIRL